jgi:hypothetical protein
MFALLNSRIFRVWNCLEDEIETFAPTPTRQQKCKWPAISHRSGLHVAEMKCKTGPEHVHMKCEELLSFQCQTASETQWNSREAESENCAAIISRREENFPRSDCIIARVLQVVKFNTEARKTCAFTFPHPRKTP